MQQSWEQKSATTVSKKKKQEAAQPGRKAKAIGLGGELLGTASNFPEAEAEQAHALVETQGEHKDEGEGIELAR